MSFKSAVLNTTTEARTTNGMKALASTLNQNVDLFFKIGASRGKDITLQFEKALQESPEIALRTLQWARDVRGGAGERELFRQGLRFLEKNYKEYLLNTELLAKVPLIGRWDDLLIFSDDAVKTRAFELIQMALEAQNGLAAKWMPRKGEVAVQLRTFLGMSPKQYRKTLVNLTKVVETQMCAKNWDEINFSHVPSLAMARYTKAFAKNAPAAFTTYKEALKAGDPSVKVNAGAVYPYDVTKTIKNGDAALADEQWKALPNYMGDANVLPLVDVSGSMSCPAGGWQSKSQLTCMDVAISLGLYCSDKNTGPFKDLFLTFSEKSKMVHLTGTLSQKMRQMQGSDWGYNTNLTSAFNEILRVAVTNKVAPEDMPQALLIMSDMQFDQACRDHSAIEMIKAKYEEAGYKIPGVIFWNLNAHDNVPVRFDARGTALISGFSPAIMKSVLTSNFDDMTPQGIMMKAIMDDKYSLGEVHV